MEDAAVAGFDAPYSIPADGSANSARWHTPRPDRSPLTLHEVKDILRQDTVICAHLMNGSSPFGDGFPVVDGWARDGEELARRVMRGLNALKDDENGLTLVIACAGAYQQGRMDHLMIWNISVAGGSARLQVGNQENIGGRHYPTGQVNTAALWQRLDPAGSRNSNAPATPVASFAHTPVGISVARHGLYINLYPATASEKFAAALAAVSAEEAGQRFGFFDGQKSCFTTARDLLGATGTRGPHGADIDWGERRPQPVVPEIFNKLSLLTNNERQVGIETMHSRSWDLNDARVRQEFRRDKALFALLAARLGPWINRKPGAWQVHIRPALPRLA